MSKANETAKRSGEELFMETYRQIFAERWNPLLEGLKAPEEQEAFTLGASKRPYFLSKASVIAARALEARPGERILDLCAAPGGKTLVLLGELFPQYSGDSPQLNDQGSTDGHLVANEFSSSRRARLKRVIEEFVPEEIRPHVEIRGKDGIRYGLIEAVKYDRILVDAPCSGERHLLEHPEELKKWSPARSKNLSKKQYGLLTSALLAVKPGGKLLYSTCTLSPEENDGVILRLLRKKGDTAQLDLPDLPPGVDAERTETGYLFLPDKNRIGPFFFSRLAKRI